MLKKDAEKFSTRSEIMQFFQKLTEPGVGGSYRFLSYGIPVRLVWIENHPNQHINHSILNTNTHTGLAYFTLVLPFISQIVFGIDTYCYNLLV